jgi:hypothetical protein
VKQGYESVETRLEAVLELQINLIIILEAAEERVAGALEPIDP